MLSLQKNIFLYFRTPTFYSKIHKHRGTFFERGGGGGGVTN